MLKQTHHIINRVTLSLLRNNVIPSFARYPLLFKSLLLFSITILYSISSSAQWPLDKANDLFKDASYTDAADYYEIVLKKDSTNSVALHNICTSLLNINDYDRVEKYFATLVKLPDAKPIDLYNYAGVLLVNGKSNEAKKWFEKYKLKDGRDTRADDFIEGLSTPTTGRSNAYKVERLEFNTTNPEFCPALFYNNMVYVTEDNSFSMVKRDHSWTDQPFLNLNMVLSDGKKFSDPEVFNDKLHVKYNIGPVCFASTFKEMYVTENSVEGTGENDFVVRLKIYLYKLIDKEWIRDEAFPFNNSNYNTAHPALNKDNTVLYFSSDMPGGYGGMDIYRSVKLNGKWQKPINMGSMVNTKGNETFPAMAPDGNLYFSSNGHYGFGGLDLFSIKLSSDSADCMLTHYPQPINSKDDDFGVVLNDDGTTGYFSSNRQNRGIDDDIYKFTKLCKEFAGRVVTGIEKSPVNEAIVVLYYDNRAVDVFKTCSDGNFSFCLQDNKNYTVQVTKQPFDIVKTDITTLKEQLKRPDDIAIIGLHSESVNELKITGKVYVANDKKPILGQKISLLDISGEVIEDVLTDENGKYTFNNLQANSDYQVHISREKCGETTLKKNTRSLSGVDSLVVDFPMFCEGDIIRIDNIYYDLGKSTIRPDAAKELDKLVDILNQYPGMNIELRSNTDSRGSDESNMKLSQQRAEAAVQYLISRGIDVNRLVAKGYGETQLLNNCSNGVNCTEAEHEQNRRTEFKVLSVK